MRLFSLFAASVAVALSLTSCSLDGNSEAPNELGGDVNVPMGAVGNTGSFGSVNIGGTYYDVASSMEVIRNEAGVATIRLTADLSTEPALAMINSWIPSTMKDADGKINTEFRLKITSDGVQSYFKGDDPHTLVKYDAKVGDTYAVTRSDGETYTRTVTARSDQDDFPYGFYQIKTITVEQTTKNMSMAGIKKVIVKANHRFGIVYLQLVAEDNSTAGMYIYSANEN